MLATAQERCVCTSRGQCWTFCLICLCFSVLPLAKAMIQELDPNRFRIPGCRSASIDASSSRLPRSCSLLSVLLCRHPRIMCSICKAAPLQLLFWGSCVICLLRPWRPGAVLQVPEYFVGSQVQRAPKAKQETNS